MHLPAESITRISEIDHVEGVGRVTMHNILWSFWKTELERLRREGDGNG